MKKFIWKFVVASLIVLMPAGYFRYYVENNESGDIGKLGMIPFGYEYEGLDVFWYDRDSSICAKVIDVYDRDSLQSYSVITIGDSFSQFGNEGYQYKLSSRLKIPVANYKKPDYLDVPDSYIALINDGYLKTGQTVIVESVERNLIWRFSNVDTLARFKNDTNKMANNVDNDKIEPFLNKYFSWIRLMLNYRNPTAHYPLSKKCFTHPRYSNRLYVYNSEIMGDGDLLWQNIPEDAYARAARNMERIIDISADKGINVIILIATDKYDAYEPWITTKHRNNITLDKIPGNSHIFDTRPILRRAIESDIKDVYKINNTHWSTVGADIIGDSLYESMNMLGFLPSTKE